MAAEHVHCICKVNDICVDFSTGTQVYDAVRYMFEGETAKDYDHMAEKHRQEATEWLQDLGRQVRRMEQVTAYVSACYPAVS